MTEHAALDKMSNERRRTHEASPSITGPNNCTSVASLEVLGCSYCKPAKDVPAQLVHEGSRLLRPVRRIAELVEEPCDTWVGATFIPCCVRNTLNEFINRHEPLAEDIFDPELDIRCDLVVLRRRLGEGGEQGADLQGDVVPSVVKTRS